MSITKKKQFFFFGPVTKMEVGNKLNRSELRKTEQEVEGIISIWSKIWVPTLESLEALRKERDCEPFDPKYAEIWISVMDGAESDKQWYQLEFNSDGKWFVSLDESFDVVDTEVIW